MPDDLLERALDALYERISEGNIEVEPNARSPEEIMATETRETFHGERQAYFQIQHSEWSG